LVAVALEVQVAVVSVQVALVQRHHSVDCSQSQVEALEETVRLLVTLSQAAQVAMVVAVAEQILRTV
jgi:hypothetical protein